MTVSSTAPQIPGRLLGIDTMKTHTLTGEAAIRLAETTGTQLYCYANPVDDGGPVTLDQAREIVREDSSLIYAHETH